MPKDSLILWLESSTKLLILGVRQLYRAPGHAIFLVRMAVWVAVLSLMTKLLPLPRALRLLRPLRKSTAKQSLPATEIVALLDRLLTTKLFFLRPVCWKRAAVLHRYLALGGIQTKIIFGIRTEPDGYLSGHAWLEANGQPIFEPAEPNYIITYTFPSEDNLQMELASFERHNIGDR